VESHQNKSSRFDRASPPSADSSTPQKSRLPRQLRSNIRKTNRLDRVDLKSLPSPIGYRAPTRTCGMHPEAHAARDLFLAGRPPAAASREHHGWILPLSGCLHPQPLFYNPSRLQEPLWKSAALSPARTNPASPYSFRDACAQPVTLSLFPGYEFHRLWGNDSVPELPSDGTLRRRNLAISPRNTRLPLRFLHPYRPTRQRAPSSSTPRWLSQEIQQKLPGMLEVFRTRSSRHAHH